MPRPVIAAVDPHRMDPDSAALGVVLARLTGARLLLAAVSRVEPTVGRMYPECAQPLIDEATEALEGVRAQVAPLAAPDVAVATVELAAAGSPAGPLHALAERENAKALVVGSSARGRWGRVLPGAVTDRVLHGAPCAVAVAPAGFGPDLASRGLRLIGAAFTDSPDGYAALACACDLARSAGALVKVLTVRQPLAWVMNGAVDGPLRATIEMAAEQDTKNRLEIGENTVPADLRAGGELLTGHAADALANASADVDLLVCGSRGHGPVRRVLLGGTSHALVRKAACPVLVAPLGAVAGEVHPVSDAAVA